MQILQCQALREASRVTYAAREQFTTNTEHIQVDTSVWIAMEQISHLHAYMYMFACSMWKISYFVSGKLLIVIFMQLHVRRAEQVSDILYIYLLAST